MPKKKSKRKEGIKADPAKDSEAIARIFELCPWLAVSQTSRGAGSSSGTGPNQPVAHDSGITDPGEGDDAVADLYRTMTVINRFGYFLMMHAIDTIPPPLLERLGDLYTARLVTDMPVDFRQDLVFYIDILREAGSVRGVSTFSTPRIAFEMGKLILRGVEIELVVTRELAESLLKPPYRQMAIRLVGFGNLHFRIAHVPIDVGLTVTDRHLSVGFFTRKAHHYDKFYDLVCTAPRARAWGYEMYQYYRDNSVPVEDFFAEIDG